MSRRSECFNRAMPSLDAMAAGRDPSKWPLLSDHGKGAGRIRAAAQSVCRSMRPPPGGEGELPRERDREAARAERLFVAEMRLVEAGLRHLIPVLLLIAENGNDRAASLERIPRRTYFRHRDELLGFFAPDYHTQVNR